MLLLCRFCIIQLVSLFYVRFTRSTQNYRISNLARSTLAYYLSEEDRKIKLVELFQIIAQNIKTLIPEPSKRKVLGKTLCGVFDLIDIESWLLRNYALLISCTDEVQMLKLLWPLLRSKVQNRTFQKCDIDDALQNLVIGWIQGMSFYGLLTQLSSSGAMLVAKSQKRHFKLEHTIEICESALGYDAPLIVGAVSEIFLFLQLPNSEPTVEILSNLQKRLRYGLAQPIGIVLYELGFSDRIVASDISSSVRFPDTRRATVIQTILENKSTLQTLLSRYPSYFSNVLDSITNTSDQK